MLPPSRRIKKTEFDSIRRTPKKIFSSKNFVLKLFYINSGFSRFAVVVSLPVSKKAVQRNKIKRQMKDIISGCLGKIKRGYAILIYAGKGSSKLSFQEMREELLILFKKAKILKNV